ncbi:MAG: type IV secretion system DNA-binding domain-containing protein [Methylophilus sp.]
MGLLGNLLGKPNTIQREKITLGGVGIPSRLEPYHFLFAGSTGTGKTTLLDEALSAIIPRGDRVIVCDPNGHHLSHFYQDGDVVLNPFDRRSQGWSIFNEVHKDFDYDRLAKSVIPNGSGGDAQWHHYSQVLLSESLRALMLRGENTTESLMRWATTVKKEELAKLLEGTPAQGLFDSDAAKALASTRFILTSYLSAHKYIKTGDFSLRNWLESEQRNLFITWREDMQSSLIPLISTWVDILASAVLSLPPSEDRRIWLVLDELGGLGKISSLESALTRGRKHGLCVIAGLQSTAQLDRIYGKDGAVVLRSCFRNLVVLGIAKADPDTAETLSRSLGEREVERDQKSRTESPQGISKSVTTLQKMERIALASDINQLPDLSAYVALAANNPAILVKFDPVQLPVIANGLEE